MRELEKHRYVYFLGNKKENKLIGKGFQKEEKKENKLMNFVKQGGVAGF